MPKNQTIALGWKTNQQGDPISWVSRRKTNEIPSQNQTVSLEAGCFATNTAIIAQSGSGKSFFLGRLIEELLLQTKAKVIVFDPNSDFRVVTQSVDRRKWENPVYNTASRTGWLPTESNPDLFLEKWKSTHIRIDSNIILQSDKLVVVPHEIKRIVIPWKDLPPEFIIGEDQSFGAADVALCHEILNKIIIFLDEAVKNKVNITNEEVIALANAIHAAAHFDEIFSAPSLRAKNDLLRAIDPNGFLPPSLKVAFDKKQLVDPNCLRQYLAIATSSFESRLFGLSDPVINPNERLRILDLASLLDKSVRLALVSTTISEMWRDMHAKWRDAMDKPPETDERVPVFIVVDEAHHLVARDPSSRLQKLLVHQFREIATEGRKFGVFLILVTQRPDRLDSIVAGECVNIAAMRLTSQGAIDEAGNTFSLDGTMMESLKKVKNIDPGRVVLLGAWSRESPTNLYVAARRTAEGGRNIRANFWAGRSKA